MTDSQTWEDLSASVDSLVNERRIRNIAKEFSETKETFLNVAVWKKIDTETDEPYLSICLEDNTWKSKAGGQDGGQNSRPNAQNSEPKKTTTALPEDGTDDIAF